MFCLLKYMNYLYYYFLIFFQNAYRNSKFALVITCLVLYLPIFVLATFSARMFYILWPNKDVFINQIQFRWNIHSGGVSHLILCNSIFNLHSSSVFTSDFFVCCTFSVLVHFMLNYDLFIYLCFPPDSEALEERNCSLSLRFIFCISSVHHTARHMLGTQQRYT